MYFVHAGPYAFLQHYVPGHSPLKTIALDLPAPANVDAQSYEHSIVVSASVVLASLMQDASVSSLRLGGVTGWPQTIRVTHEPLTELSIQWYDTSLSEVRTWHQLRRGGD